MVEVLSKMLRAKIYPAVGRCIYCGTARDEVTLTQEHIIPESLGGMLKLPEASCGQCQKFTSAFEGQNAGRLFRPVRRQFNMPSKRRGRARNEQSKNETFLVNVDGVRRRVPAKDYPGLLLSFSFPYPTALLGIAPTFESFTGGITLGTLPQFGERLNALRAKYGNKVSFPTFGSAEDVGRLLAKIAHAYAVAELGLDGFKPYLLGIIRGHDLNLLRHVVGSALTASTVGDDLHEIELLDPNVLDSRNLVVAKVRLFANYPGIATHYVVAGERT